MRINILNELCYFVGTMWYLKQTFKYNLGGMWLTKDYVSSFILYLGIDKISVDKIRYSLDSIRWSYYIGNRLGSCICSCSGS